ncbi:MAG: tRNA pseudouridine synthase B [Chlamydiae bacterium]|nr:tRNA pseudouridine synthase B [Chlamydiota bacterium]
MILKNDLTGLALLNKPKGKTSFYLVSFLRKLTGVRCIGHAGTLDPFATGLMVMLIGRPYTRLSNRFLLSDKAYNAQIHLGRTTDSYDIDGELISTSDKIPTLVEVEQAILKFQGEILQCPPMFSAKKIGGKKLYELARKGIEIPRESKKVRVAIILHDYTYPHIHLTVTCSSGTYIRSIAHDLGQLLGCGAFLETLVRTHVGSFNLESAQNCDELLTIDDLNLRRQL